MSGKISASTRFTEALLHWYAWHGRSLPWVGVRDPYKIWLSEILLQQTRVEQGLSYYQAFVETFPSVDVLADAEEQEVFKLWEGLGYYSRARNLISTAREVAFNRGGIFPETPETLMELKGIGPYTARAIASFAFNYPAAVVDGNVNRVLSRVFGVREAIDQPAGKRKMQELADSLLPQDDSAMFNQAMMDFGSLVCKPAKPACADCCMQNFCFAFQEGMTDQLPVKMKKVPRQSRYYHYIVVHDERKILIRLRKEKDIWQDLYDFPVVESNRLEELEWVGEHLTDTGIQVDFNRNSMELFGPFKQILTHRTIHALFLVIKINAGKVPEPDGCFWVNKDELINFPFPVVVRKFLSEFN